MASEHYINSYRDLALNAIEDLKNYSNDEGPERLMVSYRGYTKDLERLDNTRPAPAEDEVTIPRNPTEAMMNAGLYHCSHDMEWSDLFTAWQAMFDAVTLDGGMTEHAKASPAPAATDTGLVTVAWQSIGSAPKDGTKVLLYIPNNPHRLVCVGYYDTDHNEWVAKDVKVEPSHYIGLPIPTPAGDQHEN